MMYVTFEWTDFVVGVVVCSMAAFSVAVAVVHIYFRRKRAFMDQLASNWPTEGDIDAEE
jgi:hypothetical protein